MIDTARRVNQTQNACSAPYALVTQALQLYRVKFGTFMNDPRSGRAAALTGEQAPIKKAWLYLRDREIKGEYNTNVYQWIDLLLWSTEIPFVSLVQAPRSKAASPWA